VRPSPPLLRHAAHCYNCSDAVEHAGMGRRHASHCTAYGTLSAAPSSPPEDAPVNHYASTLEVAPVRAQDAPRRRDWRKIRQDGRQLHSTVRHAATHSEIVRYACKSPSPWPIKGRRSPPPPPQGHRATVSSQSYALRFPTILALASIIALGTWRPRLLSRLACSHPSTGTPVRSNTMPRAHPCWTYDSGRN
jgi:hypothetical protein